MKHESIIQNLKGNLAVFQSIFSNISEEERRWKPAEDKWSIHEVLCHLVDEEREDFKVRIQHIFDGKEERFPIIDPEGWVESRKYLDQDYNQKLIEFQNELQESVKWLNQLGSVDWQLAWTHPVSGKPYSAEMFLSNWLAHDYMHIRQVQNLRIQYLGEIANGISLDYAG